LTQEELERNDNTCTSNSGHRRNWEVITTPAPVTVVIGGTGKE
jgi:hypothetical protein